MPKKKLIIRWLGKQEYLACWQAMRAFTDQRNHETLDEIWLLEHPPVFTQGQNGKSEHVLNTSDIPIIQTDRGGQITYHGPGQLIAYTLIDIQRKQYTIRQLVSHLEKAVIDLLHEYSLTATAKREAPGVYINDQKICSLGLRVRKGSAYHGLALNIAMDLHPFSNINPCGIQQLKMTQLSELGGPNQLQTVGERLSYYLAQQLEYSAMEHYYAA